MKESYWGYWLIVLGVLIIFVLLLVQHFTSNNTQDYYLIKEISESAMQDAIDYTYYKTYNELKINKEKFEEVFLRRFAEDASLSNTYTIEFYDIYESPPKVSIKVTSSASSYSITSSSDSLDMVNKIDAIMEADTQVSTFKETRTIPSSANGYFEEFFDKEAERIDYSKYENCVYDGKTYTVTKCGYRKATLFDDNGEVFCVGVNVDNPSDWICGSKEGSYVLKPDGSNIKYNGWDKICGVIS